MGRCKFSYDPADELVAFADADTRDSSFMSAAFRAQDANSARTMAHLADADFVGESAIPEEHHGTPPAPMVARHADALSADQDIFVSVASVVSFDLRGSPVPLAVSYSPNDWELIINGRPGHAPDPLAAADRAVFLHDVSGLDDRNTNDIYGVTPKPLALAT